MSMNVPNDSTRNRCETCGSGSLDVVSRIIVVKTMRDSVPCVCGETEEAAYSITECESRHMSALPLEIYDYPALPEEAMTEWIERDGGVLTERVFCHRCADEVNRASVRSVASATQPLEVVCRCGSCGHQTAIPDRDIAL